MKGKKRVTHKYPRCTVTWADHSIEYGDFPIEDIKKMGKQPYYGEYSGYLVGNFKQVIIICTNIWEDGQVSDPMRIMKRSIIHMEVEEKE